MDELERMHQIIHDLRNPVGSVSMAIEMMLGPLKSSLDAMEPELARRVEGTLNALYESAQQLRHLVSDLGRIATGGPSPGPLRTPSPVPSVVALTEEEPVETKEPPVVQARCTEVNIQDLLRRLEILTVTRSTLPALLAVDATSDLTLTANGPELLRALSNLVENAIEASAAASPGPGPWTVAVEAKPDGDGLCIEVRNHGAPLAAELLAWLRAPRDSAIPESGKGEGLHGVGLRVVRRVAEECGGTLEGGSKKGETTMRLRFPGSAI